MIIQYKTPEAEANHIDYDVNKNKTTVCFDDELTLKLSKIEKDDPVHKDICFDEDGDLVVGAAAGWAYVAEIDIPARRYEDVPVEGGEEGETEHRPLPLDMDTVTLTLWAVD